MTSDTAAARLALACLDLTSLKDDDSADSIEALARKAHTPHGAPAALCVHAPFVPVARRTLDALGLAAVRVATVVNFPHGEAAAAVVVDEIRTALDLGADEIDAVFPWRALRTGDAAAGAALVRACRRACGTATLKVILESGELRDTTLIREASGIAIAEGADFLKTSTGKVAINATPEAAASMLGVIRAHGARVGLKVAGGVATVSDVQRYMALAAPVYGTLSPDNLRFGASGLLAALLSTLDGAPAGTTAQGSY